MLFFNQELAIILNPKKISNAIIKRAIKGAKTQLEMPRSTKIISKGSIGYSLANPDKIKTRPTIILKIGFKNLILDD